ncbi:hypothetical protein PFISCL1PPCAC_6109, partial [Pristionchus fissidentatus]
PDEDFGEQIEKPTSDYWWLLAFIPALVLMIAGIFYYRYKQQRKRLLARKTYIKVVHKADATVGDVQWHESSQSKSISDEDNSSSRVTKKGPKSVKQFMHEYFERLTSPEKTQERDEK